MRCAEPRPPRQSTLKRLEQALLAAFPTRSDLARMIRVGLDENLEAITGAGSLQTIVFELVGWANAHGKLDTLISLPPARRILTTPACTPSTKTARSRPHP